MDTKKLQIIAKVVNVICPCGGNCEEENGERAIGYLDKVVWCRLCGTRYEVPVTAFPKFELPPSGEDPGFNFSTHTYEQLQREHRCSCGAVGAQFPDDEELPDDMVIYVCENAHSFLVERKYVVEEKVAEEVEFADLKALVSVEYSPEFIAYVDSLGNPFK